ncbi:cysteine proteinase [Rhizophagus clarus]|uniref:ubiquitinyl hydrolase 1 n=1 Tax=Rhizophagus clarus TaxID=94130 RepID=A0A8H3LVF2_9GLOM|nr:cysteine proteinase [Rhizophagus clarus]
MIYIYTHIHIHIYIYFGNFRQGGTTILLTYRYRKNNNMDSSDTEDVKDIIPLPAVTDYEAIANKIMPDLGQEVEDFKYNTWHVTNWRHLEKRITGPEFEVGNWKWRILLFPLGNNNQDTVSIYLDFVNPMGAPTGWHSCVQFALVLWNPEDATQYIFHHAHHRFTAEESDWVNITAFVQVLKDLTGVLWHNFINYDSRKETQYVGLKNQGTTSYMNSLLQSLYFTTYFRKAVYQIPTEDDEPISSIPLMLQRAFYQMQISNTPVGTTELAKSFGSDSIDTFMQHDLRGFKRVLQDFLEGKMKGTKADGAITKPFVGKIKSYIKCINVDCESSRVEDFFDIQLNVKGCKTLRDSFKNYIQEKTLEGDNKYLAEGYGLQDAKKGVIFESFPPVLHLQLKRFEYDIQSDKMVKINDRLEFPIEIDLEEFLSEDADRSNPNKYLLYGVLVHSGDLYGGHYFILLKPENNGKWFKFDDERVTPVIDREVLEDNYGSEYPNVNTITIRTAGRNYKQFTNAYRLVYIRESDVDEMLSPVVPEDIPGHLLRRVEQERAIEKLMRNEMGERHLYLIVKIVTAERFKVHQGFDLANFDDRHYPLSEVYSYKILKTETYGAFKDNISRTFNILPQQVRFWVFVYRQNKTVRPDAPIPETYTNTSMEEIHKKMTSRQKEMKLYMETWFPTAPEANHIMVFLKYFDPNKQALEGLGHLYIQKFGKVGDITRVLCEKKEFPPGTPLKIYEEIEPNIIEEMKFKSTFQQSEIQDGDIICFQKALTDKEIQEHTSAGRYCDIPHFYESLTLRIVVSFKQKFVCSSYTVDTVETVETVEVVTAENFKEHQGFDLVDFGDYRDSLPKVYLCEILKKETYGVFKENISRKFNVPPEQVQFWVLKSRQNDTIRPYIPIPEFFFKTSMEEICANLNSKQNELKLFMEIADKPINGNMWFPITGGSNSILIFLKYFNPNTQTLKGLCHLYVQKSGKIKDYINLFCEKENLPPNTPLKIYEEIGPNLIKEMKLDSTFQLRNGDIICFQKDLTEKDKQKYIKFGYIYSIPQFYESLTLNVVRPKVKPEFDLVLNKKWTYDQVAGAVAAHLNTDPLKLRFTTAHSTSGTPKNVIKRTTTQTLSEMLQTTYLSPPAYVLFYEMLDISIVELETKKFIKVYWLGNTVKDEEAIDLRLSKNAVVSDVIEEILKKVTLPSPNLRIRLFEVHHNKIQKEYTGTEPIERISEYVSLYAEEMPQDEIHADQNDRTIQVYHFTKDPIRVHGIPFKFAIKKGETLADTKVRLRHRLDMDGKDFSKVKIAIVPGTSYAKPEYLEDDGIILSEKKLSNEECLGLDHVDKTGRVGGVGGEERVIFIRG